MSVMDAIQFVLKNHTRAHLNKEHAQEKDIRIQRYKYTSSPISLQKENFGMPVVMSSAF